MYHPQHIKSYMSLLSNQIGKKRKQKKQILIVTFNNASKKWFFAFSLKKFQWNMIINYFYWSWQIVQW